MTLPSRFSPTHLPVSFHEGDVTPGLAIPTKYWGMEEGKHR